MNDRVATVLACRIEAQAIPVTVQNLAGFFQLLCTAPFATVLQWAFSAAALAAVAVIAHRRRLVDLPFAGATVTALLVNPHVLVHDLSLLLIPAAIAIRHARAQGLTLWLLLTAGYVMALAGIPLSHWIPIQLSVLVMAALLLWLLQAGRRAAGCTVHGTEDDLPPRLRPSPVASRQVVDERVDGDSLAGQPFLSH